MINSPYAKKGLRTLVRIFGDKRTKVRNPNKKTGFPKKMRKVSY